MGQPLELVDVPFEPIKSQILLTVRVGETTDLRFLVDTGGDPSAVDLKTALRVGLRVDTTISGEAEGVGAGRAAIYPATISGLRIDTLHIPEIPALAIDLSRVSERLGFELAGVLGYSFLEGRIVEIDYPSQRFRLLGMPRAYTSKDLRVPLKNSEEDRIPVLDDVVSINGVRIPVTLDTGSSLTVEVFPNARSRLGDALWAMAGKDESAVGARGKTRISRVQADSVSIGSWTLGTRDVLLSERSGDDPSRMGNLGNGALSSFVLTLDYLNGEIVFSKPDD